MRKDDAALVERVLAGDETAFATLVKRYEKQVHALAWRTVGDFHIAEDITQETFLSAYQKLATLKDPCRFPGWLNAIATRRCLAWFREKRLDFLAPENMELAMGQADPYSGYLAGEQAKDAAHELREIVKKLLAKLSESERAVIILHYFDRMSCEEIAAFLGVTTNTIKSRLSRARNRLKKNEPLLDNFQIFATLNKAVKTEHNITVSFDVTTEGGEPVGKGTTTLTRNDTLLKFNDCGWEGYDACYGPSMLLLGTSITPYLLKFPLVVGDTWTQEGFWNSEARTTLEGYEQVEVSNGVFPTCLKHKSVLIDTDLNSQNNQRSFIDGKRYKPSDRHLSPFINGVRYLWFAEGVGLVKVRYERSSGITTDAELLEYSVPEKKQEYLPLQTGATYTYKWYDAYCAETVIEKWRVIENF